MSKFSYSPGLPAYGTTGQDGSTGLQGVSLYFTSYDGQSDGTTLKSKIADNRVLLSSTDTIPGYPNRVYSNGDMFIDTNGKLYEIDFDETYYYKDTGSTINVEGYFANLKDMSNISYTRVSNKHTTTGYKYVVDNVISKNPGDYTTYPTAIYDNLPADFSRINHVDISVGSYYLFDLWTLGSTDGNTNDADAISLVRNKGNNVWRLGNYSASTQRATALYLDFTSIVSNNINLDASLTCKNISTAPLVESNLIVRCGAYNSGSGSGKAGGITICGGRNTVQNAGDVSIGGGSGYDGGDLTLVGGGATNNGGHVIIRGGKGSSDAGDVEISGGYGDIGNWTTFGEIEIGKYHTYRIVVNPNGNDTNFTINGENVDNVFRVDAGLDAIYMASITANDGNVTVRYTTASGLISQPTSDIKFKKDVEEWNIDAINILTKFHPKQFVWKNDPKNKIKTGWIAQEGVEFIPDMFPYDEKEKRYLLAEFRILPYLHKSTLQLNDKIKKLEEVIEKQQTQINELLKIK